MGEELQFVPIYGVDASRVGVERGQREDGAACRLRVAELLGPIDPDGWGVKTDQTYRYLLLIYSDKSK